MKNSNHINLLWIITACLLFCAFLIPLSSAADPEHISATLVRHISPDNITEQSSLFLFSGDYILCYDGGLSLYSLRDNSTRPVAIKKEGKWIYWPTLSGDSIAWYQYPGEIHVYNISSGEERVLPDAATTGASKTYARAGIGDTDVARWMPSADGDRVALLQGHAPNTYGDSDIFLLNLTTNGMIPVEESPLAHGGLSLNGNRVLWYTPIDKTNSRICLYDLLTGKETVIAPEPGQKVQTTLSGTYAAWIDARDPLMYPTPLPQVTVYNISAGTTRKIPTTTMRQSSPLLAGDYVVYTECFTPTGKSAFKQTCDSRIFDILTGAVMEFPVLQNGRDMNSDYEYDRRIHAYSNGRFLIEEIHGDKRVFGVYRIENLRPVNTKATPVPAPSTPPAETTASLNVSSPPSPAQPAAGAGAEVLVLAVLAICGITRKKW
ncbi:hypothetical protein [Methanoregula sp.]|uniref:hypothetical protein n=1 Tax=Methanoregula sp. TaxID=2052170 RepID=UPI003562DAC1